MDNLSVKDQIIVFCHIQGCTNAFIATELNLPEEHVRLKLGTEKFQAYAKHLKYKLFSEDPKKRFNDLLPFATDAIEDALKDPGTKIQTRLAAAQEVTDRVMGKPKQTIDVEGSLIRGLIDRLDKKKQNDIIDIPGSIENNALLPAPNENPNRDPVDKWVEENL